MHDLQVLWQESLGYSAEDLTALDVREPLPQQRPRELPDHNGFGSWEDSAQNCTSLVRCTSVKLRVGAHAHAQCHVDFTLGR